MSDEPSSAHDGKEQAALELLRLIVSVEKTEPKDSKYFLELMVDCVRASTGPAPRVALELLQLIAAVEGSDKTRDRGYFLTLMAGCGTASSGKLELAEINGMLRGPGDTEG
jgi:hypothetical protein